MALQHELSGLGKDRITMSRIDIEVGRTDYQVLAIGRLENRDASRLEDPPRFSKEIHQGLERQVFDDVKAGHAPWLFARSERM